MSKKFVFPPLSSEAYLELERCYNQTDQAETRLRYQIVLLAAKLYSIDQIARLVLRSRDTVSRVLKRYFEAGIQAVPRGHSSGRHPKVNQAWQTELLRVIELDPHQVGVASANWTTQLLADYLAAKTGLVVDQETVRLYLHHNGYVCKRPTWSLKRKAEAQPDFSKKDWRWR